MYDDVIVPQEFNTVPASGRSGGACERYEFRMCNAGLLPISATYQILLPSGSAHACGDSIVQRWTQTV